MTNTDATFDEWCLLELMGHRRLAGRVRETTLAGGAFLRIDVYGEPEEGGMVAGVIAEPAEPDEPIATQFYSPASVYAITPMSESVCRRFAVNHGANEPVSRFDLALPAPPAPSNTREAEFDEDDGHRNPPF